MNEWIEMLNERTLKGQAPKEAPSIRTLILKVRGAPLRGINASTLG